MRACRITASGAPRGGRTLDHATSEIYSVFFVEEEGTRSSFHRLRDVIETQGLFSWLYVERDLPYWLTEAVGGKVAPLRLTQVHRALRQLGITLIPAYSPEARGRSERMFRTLQERCPKNYTWRTSRTWRPPIGFSPSSFSLRSIRDLRCRPRSPARRLCPLDWDGARRSPLCPGRTDCARKTRCTIERYACRFRKTGIASIM